VNRSGLKIFGFLISQLNKFMTKHELKQQIVRRTALDDRKTRGWLKSEGLDADTFTDTALPLIQAQRIAHNCLKHYGRFLGPNEAAVLNTFLKALTNQPQQRRITQAQVYKVMNIGSQVNRKAFKHYRQLERQAKTKA
jgi:hypothetical protein